MEIKVFFLVVDEEIAMVSLQHGSTYKRQTPSLEFIVYLEEYLFLCILFDIKFDDTGGLNLSSLLVIALEKLRHLHRVTAYLTQKNKKKRRKKEGVEGKKMKY